MRSGSIGWVVCALLACSSPSGEPEAPAPDAGRGAGSDGGPVALPPGCASVDATYGGFAAAFFADRCLSCHSASRSGEQRAGAPAGVDFDTEDDIAYRRTRIALRSVEQRTMPPGVPLSDCQAAQLQRYLDGLPADKECQPACEGRACGDDGCGGSCGECAEGELCSPTQACVDEACVPACQGVACGDDGCSGSCGECGPGLRCGGGQCTCEPQCDGKGCGDDGCGGSCGTCSGNQVCGLDGQCLCLPVCDELVCGDDGCGGVCGTCAAGTTCQGGDECACVPDCSGKKCGDDGCGGECPDTCRGALNCRYRSGTCAAGACVPDCQGRECGSDDCGDSCGECPDGQACGADGRCACQPDCAGKACGDDGCGGSCGSCAPGLACNGGQCGCTSDCGGRECGDDGCGGSCGQCGDGLSCSGGRCAAQCVPACAGKACGDDGCGGSCGACGAAQACEDGACVAAEVTFDAVFAIFVSKGCSDNACHSGARPAEGLDLSTPATAQAALIEVPAEQCGDRKLVARGAPAQSYLINKLTGSGMCSGSRMPKGAPALSSAQLDIVRSWISSL